MHRIGISFKLAATHDEVVDAYIHPLRDAVDASHAGVYSNYLREPHDDPADPPEHLLVFLVNDFKEGLHLLHVEMAKLPPPEDLAFHNLDPNDPPY